MEPSNKGNKSTQTTIAITYIAQSSNIDEEICDGLYYPLSL